MPDDDIWTTPGSDKNKPVPAQPAAHPDRDTNDWMAERIEPATDVPRSRGLPSNEIGTAGGLDHGDAEESRRGSQ